MRLASVNSIEEYDFLKSEIISRGLNIFFKRYSKMINLLFVGLFHRGLWLSGRNLKSNHSQYVWMSSGNSIPHDNKFETNLIGIYQTHPLCLAIYRNKYQPQSCIARYIFACEQIIYVYE